MRRWTVLMAILLAGAIHPALAADEDGEMRLRFQIFAIAGGMSEETALKERIWMGDDDGWKKVRDAVTLLDRGKFRFGQDTLDIHEGGCFWNGVSLLFGDAQQLNLSSERVRLIPAPDIFLGREESSNIRVGSKQSFEYLVRRDDGLYERQTIELPTGLTIRARPRERDERAELRDMIISVQAVGRREPAAGLSLPVGRPISQTHEYDLDLRLRLRRPYGILLRPEGGQGGILICLDVTDVPQAVLETIRREFPQSRVEEIEWEDDAERYDVDGKLADGREFEMQIARDGALRRKAIEFKASDLPKTVADAVKAAYPSGSVNEVWRTDEGGKISYRIEIEQREKDDVEVTVTAEGKIAPVED